jgi:hypothetical protein
MAFLAFGLITISPEQAFQRASTVLGWNGAVIAEIAKNRASAIVGLAGLATGFVLQVLAAIALAKGVVGLVTSAAIISAGAGFYARPLAYLLAVAVAGYLLLGVYLRRRYPKLLAVDD